MYVKNLSFFYQGETTKLKTIGYFYLGGFSVSLWVSFPSPFGLWGSHIKKTTENACISRVGPY